MINDYRNLSRFPTGSSYLNGRSQLNAKYSKISNPGKAKVKAIFTSAVIYPPWAYFPALIGLVVAKILHLPIIWYVYLARLSNLLIWLALGYLAIKLLPSGKWFLTALALTPTALSQAATIGGDGILMGLAWLLIAAVLSISAGKIKINWRWMSLMLLVAAYCAAIKDGYFLVGLLPLAIPLARFKTRRLAISFKSINLLMILTVAVLFTLRTVHAVNGIVLTPTIGMNINSAQQISYMTHHLFSYAWHILEQPFTKSFDTTYLGIVGILTNRLIYLSIFVIGIIYLCLFLTFTSAKPVPELKNKAKLVAPILLSIFVLTYLLLASAFYVGGTSVGATFVNAFYGRYFLPIIPLLLVIPLCLRNKKPTERYIPATLVGSIIGLLATVLSLQ